MIHKVILSTALFAGVVSALPPVQLVVRMKSAPDRAISLDQLSEVTFSDEKVCVKETGGGDFTIADVDFVSIRFSSEGGGALLTEISDLSESGKTAIYDINGRYVGESADALPGGVYMVVKPGHRTEKLKIRR